MDSLQRKKQNKGNSKTKEIAKRGKWSNSLAKFLPTLLKRSFMNFHLVDFTFPEGVREQPPSQKSNLHDVSKIQVIEAPDINLTKTTMLMIMVISALMMMMMMMLPIMIMIDIMVILLVNLINSSLSEYLHNSSLSDIFSSQYLTGENLLSHGLFYKTGNFHHYYILAYHFLLSFFAVYP